MLSYAQIFFSSWSWRQKVELCRLYGNREFDGKGRVLWWLLNYYDSCVCLCCMLIIISPAFFRSSESQYSENLINFVTRRKICATNLYGNLLGFSLTSDFIDCSFSPCSNLTMKSLLGMSCDEKQFPLLLLYSQSSSTSSRDYKFSFIFFLFFNIFFQANAVVECLHCI